MEQRERKIPGSSLPFIPKQQGETEMDTCRVYEAPIAVNSPTKACHTTETIVV